MAAYNQTNNFFSENKSPDLINPSERCLIKAEWQKIIFASSPARYELYKLSPKWDIPGILIRVHRNQSFEFVASAMAPFMAYAGWKPEFIYSDYDDALNINVTGKADAEILWLDFERYGKFSVSELSNWLKGRIEVLRGCTDSPILVSDWATKNDKSKDFNSAIRKLAADIPDVYVCDQAAIAQQLGEGYWDLRASRITGMPLSDKSCIFTARMYGLVWLPSVLAPRLKAVVLDLDNTLYSGILGEDGVQGIVLQQGHLALQQRVIRLREEGLFIGICSRNEMADVQNMFKTRTDFPLRLEHLSALSINWLPKAEGIRQIADKLRIGLDSILFIDDNPGELASLAGDIPNIHCLHAMDDAEATELALSLFPGLWKWKRTDTDSLRIADLKASEEREELANSAKDPQDYLRSLQVSLDFYMNPHKHLHRLGELSSKTNQFNTALLRLSESEIAKRLSDDDCGTVSIRLRDRLSDSGIIGAVFTHFKEDILFIDEICVSCRALGRGLEDFMILEVLKKIIGLKPVVRIAANYKEGPRNRPAKDWLTGFFRIKDIGSEGIYYTEWHTERVEHCLKGMPVSVEWETEYE